MSFVIAVPEFLSAAATDLANLGSTISAANAAASIPTTGVLAAGADDVSAAIAALFGAHAQAYQTISAQAATFHAQFVQTLSAGAGGVCQRRGRQRSAEFAERDQCAHPGTVGTSVDR